MSTRQQVKKGKTQIAVVVPEVVRVEIRRRAKVHGRTMSAEIRAMLYSSLDIPETMADESELVAKVVAEALQATVSAEGEGR